MVNLFNLQEQLLLGAWPFGTIMGHSSLYSDPHFPTVCGVLKYHHQTSISLKLDRIVFIQIRTLVGLIPVLQILFWEKNSSWAPHVWTNSIQSLAVIGTPGMQLQPWWSEKFTMGRLIKFFRAVIKVAFVILVVTNSYCLAVQFHLLRYSSLWKTNTHHYEQDGLLAKDYQPQYWFPLILMRFHSKH